ncbi:hypothetical protein LTR37_004827 [Vermiconidia calcicola]|uniref:Uncharacterized protein n=1 Tax=Vermiconidia calcicola TaxID=1690605 RepID=A0ACC3NL29_9PEZI|nr:hypothetical protein LTR37_004827 [Vermiconidia calcicola]
MPEIKTDVWGQVDAMEEALRYYGIAQGRVPDSPTSPSGLSTLPSMTLGHQGMPVPQRKAVPKADQVPKVATVSKPDASLKTDTPSKTNKQPKIDSWLKANDPPKLDLVTEPLPAPRKQRSGTISKFVEEGLSSRSNVPARKPVGLESPGSSMSSRNQSPNGSLQKIYRTEDGKFDMASVKSGKESVTSSSSSSRPRAKRADSASSNTSGRSRSGSFSQFARRMSNSFKDVVGIVKMDKHERLGYVRDKHVAGERMRRESDLRPGSPSTLASDRASIRSKQANQGEESQAPIKPRPANLTKGEMIGLELSKAVDPLRPKARKNTNDSDMSFGMTDIAPPGMMNECSSCSQPTWDYLVKGLCKECHALEAKIAKEKGKYEVEAWFTDPFQHPQGRSTWPDVGTPEHGYMKLTSRKKLMRIRQTIYEDPGNPFTDEVDNESVASGSWRQKPLPPPPEFEDGPDEAFWRSGTAGNMSRASEAVTSAPWPLQRPETMTVGMPTRGIDSMDKRAHRRSKSVSASPPTPTEDEYIAPRRIWRKGSVPGNELPFEVTMDRGDARDTRFYGFYDDIMRDYDRRR